MHSLDDELRELTSAGALDGETAAQELAIENRAIFTLHDELRIALYVAVALVVTGVGILVKEHLDRIGPLTLMLALALAGVGCYIPAIRARSRGNNRSAVAEYLLLLGALLLSADLGYAESQFHWFGEHWPRTLLILAAFHTVTAYALNSPLVLSLALTSLAGWFGIARGPSPASWNLAPELGVRAAVCAAVILIWRVIDARMNAARFREVFDNFAANVAFWGALSWCSSTHDRALGVLALLAFAWVAIRTALRSKRELFAVYGVGYSAIGFIIVAGQIFALPSLSGATVALIIVLAAAAVLRHLHDRVKEVQA